MSQFENLRGRLRSANEQAEAATDKLASARERRKRLDADRARAERSLDPRVVRRRFARLSASADAALTAAQQAVESTRTSRRAALAALARFTDPRQDLQRLSDSVPFLLLPVRLETRFRTTQDGRRQLLVRVYPDTCAIDAFEPMLSQAELISAREYWQGIWAAGGVEDDERGAWRGLVASHGSGRAGWIAANHAPLNNSERPTKRTRDELVLVIATDAPPDPRDQSALMAYWEAVWRGAGEAAVVDAALDRLADAVGAATRASELAGAYRPYNLEDRPPDPPRVTVAFAVFSADSDTKRDSWSRPPTVRVMPDRFVLIASSDEDHIEALGEPIISPLVVGPDPSAPPDEQLRPTAEGLHVPEDMRWLVDFDRAVDAGMGFVVDLTIAQASRGIDRLVVLGVRLSDTPEDGQAIVEELLAHHRDAGSGLSLVTQGTPTNNTERQQAGFTRAEDPDESFDAQARGPLFDATDDPLQRRDGQWLAELLGIRPQVLQHTPRSDATDQLEARAMQIALWPATLGYFLETMMGPLVSDDDIRAARAFFTRHVSGRGPLPAIRIGRQPYGILATTAFSRMRWPASTLSPVSGQTDAKFLQRLAAMLDTADEDWRRLARTAAFVGREGGDPHATLLEILGLHPSSVQFHQRYAQSLSHLFNHLTLAGSDIGYDVADIAAAGLERQALRLLQRLGHDGGARPAILDRYFFGGQTVLQGHVIDDQPLSETKPIRAWTPRDRNYIQWLTDAARQSLEVLRRQTGFIDDRPPSALLYLLLRHALLLGYHDTGYQLHRSVGIKRAEALAAMKREPEFVHVAPSEVSDSRWQMLYAREPQITGSRTRRLAEHIADIIPSATEASELREQLAALERLATVPTARLERAFAEHVDCCAYRVDAWRLGLVNYQLQAMRYASSQQHPPSDADGSQARRGVHLGAYGWLEDVRPKPGRLESAQLADDLAAEFDGGDDPPLAYDRSNSGYIHAPSVDQATTAAILRSGYLANATADNPDTLAIDLSSKRVRQALSLLEGMREGQSLGALLGHRLERGLHDAHDLAEVDVFIYALRKQFPLRADRLEPTRTDPDVPIDAIEARNVVDGLRLVEHVSAQSDRSYPWGRPLPAATAVQAAAIDAEVDRLLDVHDALADLALAEGVHQAVLGNYDRVAATLDSYAKGAHPPEPEVVRTPTTGSGMTHRVGLHLQPGLAAPTINATPRATAEPALNHWLATMLPPLDEISCQVTWSDPRTGTAEQQAVTMADLALQPIDLLTLVRIDAEQAMTELDDRVLQHVLDARSPRPDAELTIGYIARPESGVSVFEAAALIARLRSLVRGARPLRPSDVALAQEARSSADEAVVADRARIQAVWEQLDAIRADVATFIAGLQVLLDALPAGTNELIDAVDGLIDGAVGLLSRAARFGIPQTGRTFAYLWRRDRYARLLDRAAELVAGWDERLARFDERLADYDGLPATTPDRDRLRLLRQAELEVATVPSAGPLAPAELRAALPRRRAAFRERRDDFAALPGEASSLSALISATQALLPVSEFVADPVSLDDERASIVAFARDLATTVTALATETARRLTAAQELLAAHNAAAAASAGVEALQQAAKALLGEEFMLIPEFTLPSDQALEWRNAIDASDTLLDHLSADIGIELPVDEWLYGVARVRENIRAWEQAGLLAGGFGRPEPEMTAIQLPHRADDRWLAMQIPPGYVMDRDRLLYTAHYSVPFEASQPQCGLLLDEWTEVIPGAQQSTGLAFHFDRPNAEAPQSMLLVTPATWDGTWHWEDLVGALDDTLALAKQRAVEPDHVDGTPYARFLPATIMAATASGVSISTVIAINNDLSSHMAPRQ